MPFHFGGVSFFRSHFPDGIAGERINESRINIGRSFGNRCGRINRSRNFATRRKCDA